MQIFVKKMSCFILTFNYLKPFRPMGYMVLPLKKLLELLENH